MHTHSRCSYWQFANKVGLFLAILFVICFVWYFIRPVNQDLHMQLLHLSFFGFNNMNFSGFALGLIQSYVWGYVFAGVWLLVSCSDKDGGSCCKD